MSFRATSAVSWPLYVIPAGGLSFRANADAGLVFVIGQVFFPTTVATTVTDTPMPPAFRPLTDVFLNDATGQMQLRITPAGVLMSGGIAGTFRFRDFYFTTVTPG